MAVLVDLHVVAGADPRAVLHLRLLIRVETAGAERLAEGVQVLGQTLDDRVSNGVVWMGRRARLLGKAFDEPIDADKGLFTRCVRHNASRSGQSGGSAQSPVESAAQSGEVIRDIHQVSARPPFSLTRRTPILPTQP